MSRKELHYEFCIISPNLELPVVKMGGGERSRWDASDFLMKDKTIAEKGP